MSSVLGSALGSFGGGEIGRATVDLVLNTQKYQGQLEEAKAKTAASSAAMATAFSIVGAAAVLAAGASVKAALEQQQAQDKLANSIANSTKVSFDSLDAFDKQAESISRLTGVQDDAITSAQAMAVQFGLTADQVTALTPLVVDLSQKNGVDLTTAMSAVGKAVNGNSGALARLKLNVDKAAFATDHYGATLKALESGVKGFAAQLANDQPWRKVTANVHILEEALGKQLLPILQYSTSVLADLSGKHLPAASDAVHVLDVVYGQLTGNVDLVNQGLSETAQTSGDLQTALNAVNAAMKAGVITAADAVTQVRNLALAHGVDEEGANRLAAAEEKTTAAMAAQQKAVETLANSTHHFAGMTAKELTDWQDTVSSSITGTFETLGSTTKDIFNVTERQLGKDFRTMLRDALRFKTDLAELLALKPGTLGLSRTDAQRFEQFMISQGPGYVDAFVKASKSKQREWADEWHRTTAAVNADIASVGRNIQNLPNKVVTISISGGVPGKPGGGRVHVPVNGP